MDKKIQGLKNKLYFVCLFLFVFAFLCISQITVGAKTGNVIVDNIRPSHPRLFINSFDGIITKIQTDKRAGEWYKVLKEHADEVLNRPFPVYKEYNGTTSTSMLIPEARPFIDRMYTLAIVYKVEKDPKYLERLIADTEHVAALPDWQPNQFLNVAEFEHGMAIAYDWMYNDLTEEQRDIIKQAIIDKALNVAKINYSGTPIGILWTKQTNNWSVVCNAGNTMGALAIADEEPTLAAFIISSAINDVQGALVTYAPDGGFREGVGYWGYATNYLVYYAASLESAVKDGVELPPLYDLSKTPGVSQTGDFPIYMSGPAGGFTYGDAPPSKVSSPVLYWLANKFHKPDYADYQAKFTDQYKTLQYALPLANDIMWYDPNNCYKEKEFPLDRAFKNTNDILIRNNFTDEALYVGMKGGSNSAPHGFLNIGAFTIDALGQRWANSGIMGNYNWPGYFGSTDRYLYYVAKAQGNNTMVLNPGNSFDQEQTAEGIITAFEKGEDVAFGVIDTTSAYNKFVLESKRGVKMFDKRRKLVIQDEVKANKVNDVWWFMHTSAILDISADGKSVVMSKGGKKMVAKIVSPASASFMIMDAKPLPEAKYMAGQAETYGVKLAVFMKEMQNFTLSIEFEPVWNNDNINLIPSPLIPISEWVTKEDNTANPQNSDEVIDKLNAEISIDGIHFTMFNSNTKYYNVEIKDDKLPKVSITTANTENKTRVTNTKTFNGEACAVVIDKMGKEHKFYFNFTKSQFGSDSNLIKLNLSLEKKVERAQNWVKVKEAIASDSQSLDYAQGNMIDGDGNSRWAVDGEQWAKFELEEPTNLYAAGIAAYMGDVRFAFYDVEVSADDKNWTNVFSGKSSGKTIQPDIYELNNQEIKYIRIKCHGNSNSTWNGFTEVRFYKDKSQLEADKATWKDVFKAAAVENICNVGDSIPIYITGNFEDGTSNLISGEDATYTVSDSKIASVDNKGVVTVMGKGKFFVTVSVKAGRVLRIQRIDITVK